MQLTKTLEPTVGFGFINLKNERIKTLGFGFGV